MLRFFDSEFTPEEEEAMCALLMVHGKVTLSQFLNPNIIKLKLLFDKYNKDKSRKMDASEFKVMLEDLFLSCEKDIEELLSVTDIGDENGSAAMFVFTCCCCYCCC
ncbi:unnamed protein product [Polarella glacialis]|uniref:EF-hand domain-containing protein n=1 Tax=Polarella glacialis TaxID=89957 RepID=A0A813H636_POLGL|nr:unnamed protein product [Polarella glacialis]